MKKCLTIATASLMISLCSITAFADVVGPSIAESLLFSGFGGTFFILLFIYAVTAAITLTVILIKKHKKKKQNNVSENMNRAIYYTTGNYAESGNAQNGQSSEV